MSRLARYRELQASVPGLEALYGSIGDALVRVCGPDDRVLIVGGGGGREIDLLAVRGMAPDLTIVEPSADNLADAKQAAKGAKYPGHVTYVESGIEDLVLDQIFDAATILFVLHEVNEPEREERVLQALRSRLKPGGILLLADIGFDDGEPVDAMVSDYLRHAENLGTAQDLIELEARAVKDRRNRKATDLADRLSAAGFEITGRIGSALWYKAYMLGCSTRSAATG